jgi:hypothetical protein
MAGMIQEGLGMAAWQELAEKLGIEDVKLDFYP